MDRRKALSLFAALGSGAAVGTTTAAAADHGAMKAGADKFLAPVAGLHAHFCGIHIAKKNPQFQIVAQHYCGMRSEEMHQCLLYDSVDKNAKLLGVEYIVSDRLFRQLPEEEKKYWHPHTYEVLAGGLIAPGMTAEEEMQFMKVILHTWGKTWHTWPDPTTDVPLGEPLLMWALSGDGQENKQVVAERDRKFGVSTAKIRAQRVESFGLEVPQVPPKGFDEIGRQWTAAGADQPTLHKK